jgi:SulP family sulfate permease
LTLVGWAGRALGEARLDLSAWKGADLRREAVAGGVCAVLVIPQAITFSYLVGLPPEYGLHSAVFVTLIASLFGGTAMVGGPNTAMSILLGASIAPFAGRGSPLYIEYVLLLSLMTGLIQMLVWLLRGGALFRYFSPAAISGIKTGVGLLLVMSAIEGAMGLEPLRTTFFYEKLLVVFGAGRSLINPWASAVSGVTIVVGLILRSRVRQGYILVAVVVGGLTGGLLEGLFGPIRTQLDLLGHVPFQALPLSLPRVTREHLIVMQQLVPSAIALAIVGLSQSLVIAQDLKSSWGTKITLGREVFAQAASNLMAPFFSAFAGSGSFNRTMVAVETGSRTSMAGVLSVAGVFAATWIVSPLLTYLPMAAVAGIMALVGMGMIQVRDPQRLLATTTDRAICVATVASIALLGLETGIAVAAVSSVVSFVAEASALHVSITTDDEVEHIVVTGNLFFASMDRLTEHLSEHPEHRSRLDLTRVPYTDTAALRALERIERERAAAGGKLDVVLP